jgi:hypothetical protein
MDHRTAWNKQMEEKKKDFLHFCKLHGYNPETYYEPPPGKIIVATRMVPVSQKEEVGTNGLLWKDTPRQSLESRFPMAPPAKTNTTFK